MTISFDSQTARRLVGPESLALPRVGREPDESTLRMDLTPGGVESGRVEGAEGLLELVG